MIYSKKDCPPLPEIKDEEISARYAADIVIVGGGHAGTQCALAAAEQGASVIVLEMQQEERMRWFGEQIGAFNTKYHLEHGFGPYNPDEIVDELYHCSNYLANPVLLQKYVYNCAEMVDNMFTLLPEDSTLLDPDQFNIHQPYGKKEYPIRRSGTRTWAATMQFRGPVKMDREGPDFKYPHRGSNYAVNELSRLSELEMLALKKSQELGADWHFGTKALVLRQEESGHVTGVVAKTGDNYVEFTAKKAVVLSSGNFNRTGLNLGLSAGGHSEPDLQLGWALPRVSNAVGGGLFLMLNQRGKRFFDESNFYATPFAIDRQPDGIVCTVMDANYMDTLSQGALQHGTPDFGRPEYLQQFQEDLSHVVDAGAEGYLVRDLSTSERESFRIYGAETLEQLAAYLGYTGADAENFIASIKRYNDLCHAGKDADFGKDPECMNAIETAPFYASKSELRHEKRRGPEPVGLMTDNDFNVVDDACMPIPGLYAIGNCLGARFGPYYPTPYGGIYIGSAMTHGRVLGKHLAAI